MKLTIRHITSQDANAWERMREALWPGDPHRRDIASFFAGTAVEPLAVMFAEMAEQPVAVIEISIRRDLPHAKGIAVGYVEGLYIEPAQRGGDVARQLLRAAQQWARERGCPLFASDRADRLIFDSRYSNCRQQHSALTE